MRKEKVQETADPQNRCSRPYKLGRRETSMEATRGRVLDAARELILSENALSGFSMEAVARQAGVTRMTVYGRFGSKRGLLEAIFDEMGMRGHLRETLPAAFAQPDAQDALKAYVAAFCELWASDLTLHRRLRGFAALDQEFEAAISSRNERRHQAFELLLRRFSGQDKAPLVTNSEALIQTLLALTSFGFYDALAGECRPEEVASIVLQLVLAVLE